MRGNSGFWCVFTWIVSAPIAIAIPDLINRDPFTLRGSAPPLVIGGVLLLLGAWAATRWRHEALAGVAAGVFAGWVVLAMRTGIHGTPYGFGGIGGDLGRITAMAQRYTHTWHSADGIVGSVPADYPPLFPWVIGRFAEITGTPAWKLMGSADVIGISATVVIAFLLWRRMFDSWLALAVTLAVFLVFTEPGKPYEVMGLDLMIPWAIATFANPPRGRLQWLPAGILGGLLVLTYQGYILFALLGILALAWLGLPASAHRREYIARLARISIVGFIVCSWWLVPYITANRQMTDRYQDTLIAANPFPFLTTSPVGLLTGVGAIGLVWYWRRAWWALPLSLLTVSCYGYRILTESSFVVSGTTSVFQYTTTAITGLLAAAAVLTIATALPQLLQRLELTVPRRLMIGVFVALVALAGTNGWYDWTPGAPMLPTSVYQPSLTVLPNEAALAFAYARPSGRYPSFGRICEREPFFPAVEVIKDVQSVLGPRVNPTTVSTNEQLFDFVSWNGYLGVGATAAAATSDWYTRIHIVHELAHLPPSEFATASAHTRFGAIDVFVLYQTPDLNRWTFDPINYPYPSEFSPAQFTAAHWVTFTNLPGGVVVAVRRPAGLTVLPPNGDQPALTQLPATGVTGVCQSESQEEAP
jgi:arabinofuranosyltransferase-like protein